MYLFHKIVDVPLNKRPQSVDTSHYNSILLQTCANALLSACLNRVFAQGNVVGVTAISYETVIFEPYRVETLQKLNTKNLHNS